MTIQELHCVDRKCLCIELRRDPAKVNAGYGCYNFLFVIPTPDEAVEIDFDHPDLIKMEWIKQKHAGTGEEVLLPWFRGPFGDRAYTMMPQLDKGSTAKSLRGFDSGTNTLRRFFADELLYNILLNEPLVKHCRAPLTDLYECCEYFYTEWCKCS